MRTYRTFGAAFAQFARKSPVVVPGVVAKVVQFVPSSETDTVGAAPFSPITRTPDNAQTPGSSTSAQALAAAGAATTEHGRFDGSGVGSRTRP